MIRHTVLVAVLLMGTLVLGGCSADKEVQGNAGAAKATSERQSDVSTASGVATSTTPDGALPGSSSGTKSAPTRPKAPVKAGVKLTSLEAPPEKALAMIKLPAGFTGARFQLTVSPYGWGPGPQGASREQLLVKIETSKPLDAGAKGLNRLKADSNAVLNMEGALANRKLVATGGKYTVTISVRPEGDVGAFYVEKIDALKK